jgi:hypothetical protein
MAHQMFHYAMSTDIMWTADGRGGTIDLPAQSSDTNILNFQLLEYQNFRVFVFSINNSIQDRQAVRVEKEHVKAVCVSV